MFEKISKMYSEIYNKDLGKEVQAYGFCKAYLRNDGFMNYSSDDSIIINNDGRLSGFWNGKEHSLRSKNYDESGCFEFESLNSEIHFTISKNPEGFMTLTLESNNGIKVKDIVLCALLPISDYVFYFEKNIILGDETIKLLNDRNISVQLKRIYYYGGKETYKFILWIEQSDKDFILKSFKGMGNFGYTNKKLVKGYVNVNVTSNECLKSKDV